MKQCIAEGADVDSLLGLNGETALYASCRSSNENAVRFLLQEKNVKVDKPCLNGQTPLHIACQR
jgi:ankyrin repeat protein